MLISIRLHTFRLTSVSTPCVNGTAPCTSSVRSPAGRRLKLQFRSPRSRIIQNSISRSLERSVTEPMAKRLAAPVGGAVSLGSYEAGVLYEVLDAIHQHNPTPATLPDD